MPIGIYIVITLLAVSYVAQAIIRWIFPIIIEPITVGFLSYFGAINEFTEENITIERIKLAITVTFMCLTAAIASFGFLDIVKDKEVWTLWGFRIVIGVYFFLLTLMADFYMEHPAYIEPKAKPDFKVFWRRRTEVYGSAIANLLCIAVLQDASRNTIIGIFLAMMANFMPMIGKTFRDIYN